MIISDGCTLANGCTLEELYNGNKITVDTVTISGWTLDFVDYLDGVDLSEVALIGNDLLGPSTPQFDSIVGDEFPLDVDSSAGFGFFDYSFNVSVESGLSIIEKDLDRLQSSFSTGIYSIDIEAEAEASLVRVFDFDNGAGDSGIRLSMLNSFPRKQHWTSKIFLPSRQVQVTTTWRRWTVLPRPSTSRCPRLQPCG